MDRVYKEHGKHVGKALTPLVDFDISVVVENHTYIRIGGGVKDGILCFFRSNRPLLKQSVFPIDESHCCRFSVRRFSHFSDQEKPIERNRLAIWSIFLEKSTGWRYRFFLSKKNKPGHYMLSHARTSTIPNRRAW